MRLVASVVALSIATGLASGCSDDGGGSAEELCALVGDGRTFATLFEDGLDPTDTAQALAQLRAASVDLGELRAAAPSSVRDAIDDELAYVAALIEVLETVDPGEPAAVVAAINDLDDERAAAEAASVELGAFHAEQCRGPSTT